MSARARLANVPPTDVVIAQNSYRHLRGILAPEKALAKALENERRQPDIAALAFEERIAMMIDREVLDDRRLAQAGELEPLVLGLDGRNEPVSIDHWLQRTMSRATVAHNQNLSRRSKLPGAILCLSLFGAAVALRRRRLKLGERQL